ncbi:MAG: T9SS type A sorting domain-containing protein [Candidatus Eisenbacteria sp.]|nr:T9SS type A sorting domain-containing protein [Candidatus Eisenbacteria bacterium]
MDAVLSDIPTCTIQAYFSEVGGSGLTVKTLLYEDHGGWWPSAVLVFGNYDTEGARDDQISVLTGLGLIEGTHFYTFAVVPDEDEDFYGFIVTNEGISEKLNDLMPSDRIILACCCYGGYHQQWWGVPMNVTSSGSALVGPDWSIGADINWDNMCKLSGGLACLRYPFGSDNHLDSIVGDLTAVVLYGNKWARIVSGFGCWDWTAFRQTVLVDGELHFTVQSPDPCTMFKVYVNGEHYATIDGRTQDGFGKLYSFHCSVPPGSDCEVYEIAGGVKNAAGARPLRDGEVILDFQGQDLDEWIEPLKAQERAERHANAQPFGTWNLEDHLEDYAEKYHRPWFGTGGYPSYTQWYEYARPHQVSLAETEPSARLQAALRDKIDQVKITKFTNPQWSTWHGNNPQGFRTSDPAHVVIYTPPGLEDAGPMEAFKIGQVHPSLEVLIIAGPSDPDVARSLLYEVYEANVEFNDAHGGQEIYPEGPPMFVFGDEVDFPMMRYDDGPQGRCVQLQCHSWALVGDFNEDLDCECEIIMCPVDMDHAWAAVVQGMLWNEGNHVYTNQVICLVDDELGELQGTQLLPMTNYMDRINARWHHPPERYSVVFRESDYPNYFTMRDAVQYWYNGGGAGHIFLNGVTTDLVDNTAGLYSYEGILEDLWLEQETVVFAPTCEAVGLWWGSVWGPPLVKELMGRTDSGTAFAGMIGQVNGDYEHGHMWIGIIMMDELTNATPGETYWKVLKRTRQTFHTQFPDEPYPWGLTMCGTYIIVLAQPDTSVDWPEDWNPEETSFRMFIPTGSATIHYELAHDATVDLEVFSVDGRRVATVRKDARLAAGQYQNTWLSNVSSGTYFARLIVEDEYGTVSSIEKIIVVN